MVILGRVLAPYGLKGWLKARSFAVSPTALLDQASWWMAPKDRAGDWREFRVLSARTHSDALLAELEGLASRESVMPWRGADVAVPREALPKPAAGEFYWSDLVGMTVSNRSDVDLGTVSGLVDTGAHPVLRVLGGDGLERLIPFVPAYVDTIDKATARIVVDWQLDY